MDEDLESTRWMAVCQRDQMKSGLFVYGVVTTRIYCRSSCSSRRPLRKNVQFFSTPEAARQSGFRPCKRCRPDEFETHNQPVDAVVRACRLLEISPDLGAFSTLASELGYSERHLRRLFVDVVGVSPGTYARMQRASQVRDALRRNDSVTDALVDYGSVSYSSFHELGSSTLGMTPGRYRDGARGERISYTSVITPLGVVMAAATSRGVCFVRLDEVEATLEKQLFNEFPRAHIERDDDGLFEVATELARAVRGEGDALRLPLDIAGTAFQIRVWKALRAIPKGQTRSYSEVASTIGSPTSIRAVASACAANTVALVIPCHRVIRSDGSLGGYRWGIEKKEALLRIENELRAKPLDDESVHHAV